MFTEKGKTIEKNIQIVKEAIRQRVKGENLLP